MDAELLRGLVADAICFHSEGFRLTELGEVERVQWFDLADAALSVMPPAWPVNEAMIDAALPNLIGVAGSKVRPFGQFYPGFTADESEDANWKYYGRDRVRAALTAALSVAQGQGFVMVPVKYAPDAQKKIGWTLDVDWVCGLEPEDAEYWPGLEEAEAVILALLAAAPAQPDGVGK